MPVSIRLRRPADAAWSTLSNLPRLIATATTRKFSGPGALAIAALAVMVVVTLTVAPTPVWADVDDDMMEDLGIYVPNFFAELQDIEFGGPDRAYVFGVGGFGIVNISNLDNPTMITRYEPPGHPYVRFYRGAVYQNAAYGGGREDLMTIIDISSELSIFPVRVHGSAGQSFEGIAVNSDHLYAARHADGVEIFDLTDPLDPITVAEVTSLTNAWDIAFKGDFALVADGIGGLAILDVNDPTTPIHLTTLPTSGAAVDVDVTGDLAVVANGSAGVDIFDISDPTDAFLVSTFNTSGLAITLDATGDLVFVADWDDVEVIDVSNPAAPTPAGWENTPVRAMGLAAEGDLIVDRSVGRRDRVWQRPGRRHGRHHVYCQQQRRRSDQRDRHRRFRGQLRRPATAGVHPRTGRVARGHGLVHPRCTRLRRDIHARRLGRPGRVANYPAVDRRRQPELPQHRRPGA